MHDNERTPVIAVEYTGPHGEFAIAVPRPWRFVVRVTPPEDLRAVGEEAVTVPMDTTMEADVRTVAGTASPTATARGKREE